MPLGLDVIAAAEAIVRVANARMAGANRRVSIERGHDPRRFALLAFGGGAALTSARSCGSRRERALVPPFRASPSAGLRDRRRALRFLQTVNRGLGELDIVPLEAELREHVEAGLALVGDDEIALERTEATSSST